MIRLQRCTECGTAQYPARAVCVACLSDALTWEEAEALSGAVLARTVLHHSNETRFRAALPLAVALVRLDAGPIAVCFVGEHGPGVAVSVRARALEQVPGLSAVMPGLDPGIHFFACDPEDVDGRNESGHDDEG